MTKSKKISLFIFSILLVLANFLFVACTNKDYSKTYIECDKQNITLYVGESENATFTIKNPVDGMNNTLQYSISNPLACEVERISIQEYSSTFQFTGKKGSDTPVIFEVTSIDGSKTASVNVIIKQKSTALKPNNQSLYVSTGSKLVPTAQDFVFSEGTTERGLEFYFYGETASEELSLDDVKDGEDFINKFVSIEVKKSANFYFLIFENQDGQLFSLGEKESFGRHPFISIDDGRGGVNDELLASCHAFSLGEKLTFITKYVENESLFCQRDFTILDDIVIEDSAQFSYQILDENDIVQVFDKNNRNSHTEDNSTLKITSKSNESGYEVTSGEVTLVPSYTRIINETTKTKADYKVAFLAVTTETNSLLNVSAKSRNISVLTSTFLFSEDNDTAGTTTYYFKLSSSTGSETQTYFDIHFYVSGFENDKESSVNTTLSIPVNTKVVPQGLLVNGFSSSTGTFTFYNHYESDIYGWKEFYFNVEPADATYESISLNLKDSGLEVKYQGKIYSENTPSDANFDANKILTISNLNSSLFIRGLGGATVTDSGALMIKLSFNVFEEDSKIVTIPYKIVNGATTIEWKDGTPAIIQNNAYIDLNTESVEFPFLQTNAPFERVDVKLVSGKDIAKITSFKGDDGNIYTQDGDKYLLNLKISGKGIVGEQSSYSITLDNGVSTLLIISAIETLNDISVSTTNQDGSVKGVEDNVFYVYNKSAKDEVVDLKIISNSIESSNAISSFELENEDYLAVSIEGASQSNKLFNVVVKNNGSSTITIKAKGYKVENFTKVDASIEDYKIKIIAFDYIEQLNVYKTEEAGETYENNSQSSATYAYVYTGTPKEKSRQVTFNISTENDGYLFKTNDGWQAQSFDQSMIVWEYNKELYYYDDDIIEILGMGNFNIKSLTFTADAIANPNYEAVLIARVFQYGKTYSFTINIKLKEYITVEDITNTSLIKDNQISISMLSSNKSFIFYATEKNVTDPSITYLIKNNSIIIDDTTYKMFNIDVLESDDKYQFTISADTNFLDVAGNCEKKMSATIYIVANDWVENGQIRTEFQEKANAFKFTINFENGTEKNRLTLTDVDDVLKLTGNNLSLHYQVKSSIDVSSISDKLPLGELKGSIIGTNEQAGFYGLQVNTLSADGYAGLFSTIADGAYLQNLNFEGSIAIVSSDSTGANIGLVAGSNSGRLTNIGVTLSESSVKIKSGNVGGIVGESSGTIEQNFADTNLFKKTTIFMTGLFQVIGYGKTTDDVINFGGVAGQNSDLIQKIDGNANGYLNYMAYVLMQGEQNTKTVGSESTTIASTQFYTGGIAGVSTGAILGGKTTIDQNVVKTVSYQKYDANDFAAGKGLIVGGEVDSVGFVGGVAGKIDAIGGTTTKGFAGITSRVLVRGYTRNVAGLANFVGEGENNSNIDNTCNSFALQAVDAGKMDIDASMILIKTTTSSDFYKQDENSWEIDTNKQFNYNQIAFGEVSNFIPYVDKNGEKDEDLIKQTFTTFTTRSQQKTSISNSKDEYNGDFLVVNDTTIVQQAFFATAETGISVSANIKNGDITNEMTKEGQPQAFYMYYFCVDSSSVASLKDTVQQSLTEKLNTLNVGSKFYPFVASGDMTFTSLNTDVLTIDHVGKITVKSTGVAKVLVTSILNQTESRVIYLYVVNYFNSTLNESIVYPSQNSDSLAIDESIIHLRANKSTTVYIIPNYTLALTENDNNILTLDKDGKGVMGGVSITISSCDDISAEITFNSDDEKNQLSVQVIGNQIIFSKTSSTKEQDYNVKINTILLFADETSTDGKTYSTNVNKTLGNVKVNYTKGALTIANKKYDEVTINSKSILNDQIVVTSTAPYSATSGEETPSSGEGTPEYSVRKTSGSALSEDGSLEKELFNITFTYNSSASDDSGIYTHVFDYTLVINDTSFAFKNRDSLDIYGQYEITFSASTNNEVYTILIVNFEQTSVGAVSIDNYINPDAGLTTTKLASPGQDSLLAINISPIDGDFDSIRIENAQSNYATGHASANFALAMKKTDASDGEQFAKNTIAGAGTENGISFTRKEIENIYKDYQPYNGQIFVSYLMGTNMVQEGSQSEFIVTVYKNGQAVRTASIVLTIKLSYFVKVELDNKDSLEEQQLTYAVARGKEYKLNISSYGFQRENITLTSSNSSLGKIVERDGQYYLQITSAPVTYIDNYREFSIIASAVAIEDDIPRTLISETQIHVQEFVLNYNGDKMKNEDVVKGMGDGVINVQVGSQLELGIDLYDFIEYNENDIDVVGKIEVFLNSMTKNGSWVAKTNLKNDTTVMDSPVSADKGKEYILSKGAESTSVDNLYFKYSNYKITPKRTNYPEDNNYYFVYTGKFSLVKGAYVCVTDSKTSGKDIVNTEFRLNVYSSSSEESPIPVYDYNDLTKMQAGGYYILLNNITIPNKEEIEKAGSEPFSPIDAKFKSLDGNGLSIIFSGEYDVGSTSAIGLFSSLPEGSIIKNLNIAYNTSVIESEDDTNYGLKGLSTVKFITSASSFTFGGIVAENSGAITNCNILSENSTYLTVKADNALKASNGVIGCVVGQNNGFVTSCGVSANVKAPFGIGGVAGNNLGKISACFFQVGTLNNAPTISSHVAGMAVENGENGQILSCFVSGEQSSDKLYSGAEDKNSQITSPISAAGFVYKNKGFISDCYTDINLKHVGTESEYQVYGFVGENGGTIRNSFSLSVLPSNTNASCGFAGTNMSDEVEGNFSSCYYLSIKGDGVIDGVNVDIKSQSIEGIKELDKAGFNDTSNFTEYAYQENQSIGVNAVWFKPDGNSSDQYVKYKGVDGVSNTGSGTQTTTTYTEEYLTFAKGRLELVSPNLRMLSRREFTKSEIDEETGNVTYFYDDEETAPSKGSIHNPRIIYDANSMENEIMQATSKTGLNTTNYRIVSDIDYTKFEGISNLYKVTFAGLLEANGMKVSGISLESTSSLASAGLFAQVGYSASKQGTIKNLILVPDKVNFAQATSVGAVAGVLKYGHLCNISVLNNDNGVTVLGQNFVGGVVGRAVTSFNMKDIYSELNASANYYPNKDEIYSEVDGNESNFSYAGSIAGFVGNGKVYNVQVAKTSSVVGGRAGFVFGGIGRNSNVDYVYLSILAGASIKSNQYAGLVCGEVAGQLSHACVNGNGNSENFFAVVPKKPFAVGGIAGLLAGGKIKSSLMSQDFLVTLLDSSTAYINTVGGIVGEIDSGNNLVSEIHDTIVEGDIIGRQTLGGGMGVVNSPVKVDSVAIKSSLLTVNGQVQTPFLGGIVANISNTTSLAMTNSYCLADLSISTSSSAQDTTATVGGLIAGGAPTKLAYCYTTSKVDAEVYDSRQLGKTANYFLIEPAGENGNNKVYKNSVDAIGTKAALSYNTKPTNNESIKEVYYFGGNDDSVISGLQTYTDTATADPSQMANLFANGTFFTYKTKTKDNTVTLTINNFGTSSYNSDATTRIPGNSQKKDLYNLFTNNYQKGIRLNKNGSYYEVEGNTSVKYTLSEDKSTLTTTVTGYPSLINVSDCFKDGDDYVYALGIETKYIRIPDATWKALINGKLEEKTGEGFKTLSGEGSGQNNYTYDPNNKNQIGLYYTDDDKKGEFNNDRVIALSSLQQNALYKDDLGNIYIFEVRGGTFNYYDIFSNGDNKFTGNVKTLSLVWNMDNWNKFSSLECERNLAWTQKSLWAH